MKHAAFALALSLSGGVFPAAAHHGGHCYISSNNSHICFVRMGKQQFAAAITDGASVKPTVLAFHCTDGWRGAGALTEDTMSLIVSAICNDNAVSTTTTQVASN